MLERWRGELRWQLSGFRREVRRGINYLKTEASYRRRRELSDLAALQQLDPYLAQIVSPELLALLREKMAKTDLTVIDIGAGSKVWRAAILLGANKTICLDPAYEWYEWHSQSELESPPWPHQIFGGWYEKKRMIRLLKIGFKRLQIPRRIEGTQFHIVKGFRHGLERVIELYPVDAVSWIKQKPPESISNIILWRVFPSPGIWGQIIASLKTGGLLVTTGYGSLSLSALRDRRNYHQEISCGVDIDNTPLPLNGQTGALGLEPLINLPEFFFYQKTQHFSVKEVTTAIKRNS